MTRVRRASLASALALVLAGTGPAGPANADLPNDFSTLAKTFVNESEQHDPLVADGLGIHAYDDRLDGLFGARSGSSHDVAPSLAQADRRRDDDVHAIE